MQHDVEQLVRIKDDIPSGKFDHLGGTHSDPSQNAINAVFE
jgi:hypothetical protein